MAAPTDMSAVVPDEDGGEDGGVQGPPDKEILADHSVITVCGSAEVARDALTVLNEALETGRLNLVQRDLADEALMKVIKAVGIIAKLKNLLPRRTSVLPITEVDISGNNLLVLTPHPFTGALELSAKSLQPLQLAVQFVRVSTDVKVVRFENCNLQGTTHDKDDKVEQELIRLVKKFGAGKDARYAREVSVAGNKFEAEFAKKIIEAAYWERARAPDKEHPPKLHLDLRKNRIQSPLQLLDELRAGKNAGGTISVAAASDPEHAREKALIVVDVDDQEDRSVTPMRGGHVSAVERLRMDKRPKQFSPSPVPARRDSQHVIITERLRMDKRPRQLSPSPAPARCSRSASLSRGRNGRNGRHGISGARSRSGGCLDDHYPPGGRADSRSTAAGDSRARSHCGVRRRRGDCGGGDGGHRCRRRHHCSRGRGGGRRADSWSPSAEWQRSNSRSASNCRRNHGKRQRHH